MRDDFSFYASLDNDCCQCNQNARFSFFGSLYICSDVNNCIRGERNDTEISGVLTDIRAPSGPCKSDGATVSQCMYMGEPIYTFSYLTKPCSLHAISVSLYLLSSRHCVQSTFTQNVTNYTTLLQKMYTFVV